MTSRTVTDSRRALDLHVREAEDDDIRVREGFELPPEPFDIADRGWCCAGAVTDADEVAACVLAAARGASIVAWCSDHHLRAALADDLRRIGPTSVEELGASPLDALDQEQRALLEHIAAGSSIAAAAQELFLSVRTAERRVSNARKALGVRTTAEAVALVTAPPMARPST